MRLEDEVRVVQFAQGVGSDSELINRFQQLGKREKVIVFSDLSGFVQDLNPTEAEVDQANGLREQIGIELPESVLKGHWLATMQHILFMPGDHCDALNTLLLYLFRIVYQRHYTLLKGEADNWWYWDLSDQTIVESILEKHRTAIEDGYTNPSFRMEFETVARLWNKTGATAQVEPATVEPVTPPNPVFLSYDQVLTVSLNNLVTYMSPGLSILLSSLTNAFSVKYQIPTEQARKIVLAVLERYLIAMYNRSLFN
ncbi:MULTISPECIES: DUF5958 family protein [unclassified Spirosoma]|mgnify:CR=1 FL=1|uniref:DUF5958 family protein n=1 Tax=unclassified Spirosoma TaxID=2621999 RepID=UPI0009631472|nr:MULTISPECIES: DUF5958 family protein [unclassified Spirosoma]MBN8820703.1 hypothetical protein [Spirosoma sp.]OJW76386.1 MAG: hypothetical protein BGO59_22975 [Spirosoma sp. 48-14]